MHRFKNRNVLITGGGSGIGLATARQLASEGARCVLVSRTEEKLQKAIENLPGADHRFLGIDCSLDRELLQACRELKREIGPLYAGIFCAGVHDVRPLAVADAKHVSHILSNNVVTAAVGARAFAKVVDAEGGVIVFVSSAAALKGSGGVAAYSASKAALLGLGRSLAVELAPKRIRVNMVCPGVVRTEMTDGLFDHLSPAQIEKIKDSHLLGLGGPEDVSAAISFLISDEAKWITGTSLTVDGGFTCH